jgi:nucleoside-diphosphate-sugar epimerase
MSPSSAPIPPDAVIGPEDLILVTGAGGFIGGRVVEQLLEQGFGNIRCLARPFGNIAKLERLVKKHGEVFRGELMTGNLLSREDCLRAAEGARVILHLAAGRGEKLVPDAFMNSVVTTRNLLDAALQHRCLKRFVNISSFTVYSNQGKGRGAILDEKAPVEAKPQLRGEAYCYAKVKQDELVAEYGRKHQVPFVILRPGVVYGPGNEGISGRVGVSTFGFFLHLGGGNRIPLSYVDNCADAVILAGLRSGVDGEIFNVVDDHLPTSRQFLRLYKRHVIRFNSFYLPKPLSYFLCYLWEKYSDWSQGQLPPAFNRRLWHAYWKGSAYSNEKLKQRLGWSQRVSTEEGMLKHFESCRIKFANA